MVIGVTGTVTVATSARISANGANGVSVVSGWSGGGGAGGSILIDAASLLGDGTIAANGGGSGTSSNVGGGAGGRIALYLSSAMSPSLKLQALSSTYYTSSCIGSGGTIYSDVDGYTTLRYLGASTLPREEIYTPHTLLDRYVQHLHSVRHDSYHVAGWTLYSSTGGLVYSYPQPPPSAPSTSPTWTVS